MSRPAPFGPPWTSHPHPPAPSRPVLQASGAAPAQGGLRLLAARLLTEQIDRMSRADARLERLLAGALRAAAVRPDDCVPGERGAAGGHGAASPHRRGTVAAHGARRSRAEDFARTLGLEGSEVRVLIRFDRTLAALPRIAAAYDAGILTRAKLLAILPVVTPDTEDLWLGRAERYEAGALGSPGAAPACAEADPRAQVPAGDDFPIWMDVTAVVREALRPLGPGTDPADLTEGRIGEMPHPPVRRETLFDVCGASDTAGNEARLARLVALRQSVEWRLGRLLGVMRRHALHLDLGSASVESWAAVAPGLAAERVDALLAIDESLATLPEIADAWRRGRITWKQARLLALVAGRQGEREWLRLARQVAPERLAVLVRAAVAASSGRPPAGDGGQPASGDEAPAALPSTAGPRGITRGAPVSGSRTTSTRVS
jgi:hypothetical protein